MRKEEIKEIINDSGIVKPLIAKTIILMGLDNLRAVDEPVEDFAEEIREGEEKEAFVARRIMGLAILVAKELSDEEIVEMFKAVL